MGHMGLNLLGIFLGGCTVWVLITQQMWKALGPKKPIMCDFFASVFLGIGLRFWESRCFPEGIRFFSVENLCPMFHGRCLVIQTKETHQKHRHLMETLLALIPEPLKFHDFTGKSLKDLVEIGP